MPASDENMRSQRNILIVETETKFKSELAEFLKELGHNAMAANTANEGMQILDNQKFELLFMDLELPDINALVFLKQIKETYPSMEIIIVCTQRDSISRRKAMTMGAIDYIEKPLSKFNVQLSMERIRKFLTIQEKIHNIEESNSILNHNLDALVRDPSRTDRNLAAL